MYHKECMEVRGQFIGVLPFHYIGLHRSSLVVQTWDLLSHLAIPVYQFYIAGTMAQT